MSDKREQMYNTLKSMSQQSKMWYSLEEVLVYLAIDERTLYKKLLLYNFESRTLPGMKGEYLSRKDVEYLKQNMTSNKEN